MSTNRKTPAEPKTSVKRKRSTESPDEVESAKPKERREWTAEEDVIFDDLVKRCLKKNLNGMVRGDGRLERGSSSVQSHITALINIIERGRPTQRGKGAQE